MRIELQEALQDVQYLISLLGATPHTSANAPVRFRGIASDSREVRPGDLFLALKGEHTDGNDHIAAALAAGAAGVLSERKLIPFKGDFCFLSCESITDALLLAAGRWRKMCGACVVAVSGSAGKTTTKDAIAAVLGEVPHNAGNYNSVLGMPLSVLSFPKSDFWVCELGINHVGEMEKMSLALCPDIGVITNVGSAHIGHFGNFSTLLAEKLKLCAGMGKHGRLVMPLFLKNSSFSDPLCHLFCVGEEETADFRTENIVMSASGAKCDLRYENGVITNLTWPIPGVIGSSVLGLSAAVGLLCKRSAQQIRDGLQKAAQRLSHTRVSRVGEMLFLEDHYNASPEACFAALESLRYLSPGRVRVAVLGDMLELGEYSCLLHRSVGRAVCKAEVDYLFSYGTLAVQIAQGARDEGMPSDRIFSFASGEQALLVKEMLQHVGENAAVLFKASRAMQLERVAEELRRLL